MNRVGVDQEAVCIGDTRTQKLTSVSRRPLLCPREDILLVPTGGGTADQHRSLYNELNLNLITTKYTYYSLNLLGISKSEIILSEYAHNAKCFKE